jgi:hypothetical protein
MRLRLFRKNNVISDICVGSEGSENLEVNLITGSIDPEMLPSITTIIDPAEQAMANGNAITRFFDKLDLVYDVPIIPSMVTYWGMYDTLVNLSRRLSQDGHNPADYCVLGPHYTKSCDCNYPGDDTQAGGGGKTTKRWDPRIMGHCYETFPNAASEEMVEELRIIGGSPHLETVFETSLQIPQLLLKTCTKIYSFKACDCKAPMIYETSKYARKGRRGEDVLSQRVGFVLWGTLGECIQLVESIPVDVPREGKLKLVENIDAVSIISLPKAIEMALYASHKLRGNVVKKTYY